MQKFKAISAIVILLVFGVFYYITSYKPQPYAVATTIKYVERASTDGLLTTGTVDTVYQDVTFEVDGKPYTINKMLPEPVAVDIGPGKHTVTREGKEVGTIDVGWFDGKSVINLDLKQFVVVDMVYAENEKAYREKVAELPKNTITVGGKQYTGPFRLVEPALYVKKDWDYSFF